MSLALKAGYLKEETSSQGRPSYREEESVAGWGGRIRTSDAGTKNRCLAAWLRPNSSLLLFSHLFCISQQIKFFFFLKRPLSGLLFFDIFFIER